jgi:transposase
MEWLKAIRHRTERRQSEKVSVKSRKGSTWSFAELQAKTVYKIRLSGGVPDWVDADSSSQRRPVCGHVGRENRPNKGLLFVASIVGIRSMPI